jgi:prepilin signal peptidase PulO-like enzyme (type II secretory pathway)
MEILTRIISVILIILFGMFSAWIVNYLADTLPVKRKLSKACCQHCLKEKNWKDYLLLRRCASCGNSLNIRTWIVYGLIPVGLLLLWLFPNKTGVEIFTQNPEFHLVLRGILFVFFILVCVIDIEYRAVLIPVVIFGFVFGAVFGVIYHGWLNTIWGFAAGSGIMLLLYLLGVLFVKLLNRKRTEKLDEDALGFGDVNLSGVLGLVLGFPGIIAGLYLGIIIGGLGSLVYLAISRLSGTYKLFTPLPYAPFLIAGAAVLLFIL